MRHHKNALQRCGLAAVFVDYENLFALLNNHLDRNGYPDELITEMLDELQRYLLEERRTRVAMTRAYADFNAFDGNGPYIQRALYLQDVEPRFVPDTFQPNAAEMQLCVEATDVLHRRPDIDTFILLTGNRAYLPLVQQLRRYGRSTTIVTLEQPASSDTFPYRDPDIFLDARYLLSDASRVHVGTRGKAAPRRTASPAHNGQNGTTGTNGHTAAPDVAPTLEAITDPVLQRTIEIIEEHFGQYEEVYLTPLLRKLSELLDERKHDPKVLVSSLEAAGAVRLEKRRGFPYDYTVLILVTEHPDVQRVQQSAYERQTLPDGLDDYDEDRDAEAAYGRAPGDAVADDYDDAEWDEDLH